jgi:glycosyltransferase involved in cell wall biosynthesis
MKINTAQESVSKHGYDRQEGGFESASIVLPVINEVRSLYQTIDTIFEYAGESIREIIIIVCYKTTAESLSACNELREKYAGQIRVIPQRLPFLGGALREGLLAAGGSHVIVMFSDGESDPRSVGDLISEARGNPEVIISASRWLKGNSFEGYPAVKTLLNYLFQKAFSLLYWENITDFTFGYRIYPVQLIHAIKWEEIGHSFVLESILKPLRLNVNVLEIPSAWKARSEGKSQMKPYMYFRYLWIGLKVKITQRKRFMKLGRARGQVFH